MNHPGVQADLRPRLPFSTYNLSSILSHFLNRLRKGSWFEPSLTLNLSQVPTSSMAQADVREKVQEYPPIPSPWEFFTSGYVAGLLFTAILLHRLQNVVIPSRRRARHAYRSPLHHTTLWDRIHAAILPLDFSRASTRFCFHSFSVYYLSKMLIIWIFLVLQTCEFQLVSGGDRNGAYVGVIQGYFETLARWTMQKEMAHICWSTFCTVCGAFWVEGLIKALDGLGGGYPLGGVNSLSPFHLVSYAFLLHVYSSPVAHGFHPADNLPSRPDKHVVITITIALLQLCMFHILSISKRLSTHRLIPTALTSFLSLTHFHTTVFFHLTKTPDSRLPTPTATTRTLRRPNRYVAAGATYPLMNYVPNLFETSLLATILLTITVNAVAQLLVRGRIDHVLSGLGFLNGLPNDDDGTHNGLFANLPYDEDFTIVLLRVGVASLEATGLRGWNNEVAPIQRPKIRPRRILASKSGLDLKENAYGRVRMGRLGVAQVQYGSTSLARASAVALHKEAGRKDCGLRSARSRSAWRPQAYVPRFRQGFNNDVRIIDLGNADTSGPFSGPWSRTIVAFWQFLVVFCGVLRGMMFYLLDRARRRERKSRQAASGEGEVEDDAESADEDNNPTETDAEVYQRFLRGEDITDDEDDDEDALEGSLSTVSDEETMSDETDEERHSQERDAEVVDLFGDLFRNPDGGDIRTVPGLSRSNGEMALAHLLHGSGVASRPLTRRQWNTLTQQDHFARTESNNDSLSFVDQQAAEMVSERYYKSVEERDKEKGLEHVCVICMLESREIVCWPCRCLAMCDGCRETLSSRTPASKHRCPCCRQIVDGYSKIYIP